MIHARNSASSAHRWMACPGSINLANRFPVPPTSEFAEEGTVAHELGEKLLKEYFFGEAAGDISVIRGTKVDAEMAEYVQVYIDAVASYTSVDDVATGKKILKVEEKFSLEWLHPEMFGTNDACVYDPYTKKLTILDLKYGHGIQEPEWNAQLMCYALGAIYKLWTDDPENHTYEITSLVKDVDLVIVQPRLKHVKGTVRSWSIPTTDLFFWGLNVLRPAAIETHNENAALNSGKHCKYCAALAACPKQAEDAFALAKTDFQRPIFPSPETMTTSDLSKVMEAAETFNDWAKSVKAFAQEKMFQGVKVPGFKLVNRRGKRRWNDEGQAVNALYPIIGESIYKKELESVFQVQKLLKLLKYPKGCIDQLYYTPEIGVTIAHESDGRKEVQPTAHVDFLEMADFLQ